MRFSWWSFLPLQEAVATACPPFLSALRVADLSLGAAPPTITSIRWANHTAPCGRAGEPAARMPNAACLEVAVACGVLSRLC